MSIGRSGGLDLDIEVADLSSNNFLLMLLRFLGERFSSVISEARLVDVWDSKSRLRFEQLL
jgi:hypothetical protein